jgi:hypothetical protein
VKYEYEEDERLAISVRFIHESREVEITLDDGSRHAWPVDRLEMLDNTPDGFKPVLNPPNELLTDVQIWGGGTSIYWEKLGQIFSVDDLLAGCYGRKQWMETLSVGAV